MPVQQPEDLFRQNAIDSLASKLDGRPVATMPGLWVWLTASCAAILISAGAFLWSVEYARKETVRGWLVAEPGVVQLAHNDFATVRSLERVAGSVVRRGDAIVQLSSEVKLGNGTYSAQQALEYLQEQLASVGARSGLAREQFSTDHRALEQQLRVILEESDALDSQRREQHARVLRSIERQRGLRSAFERGAIAKADMLRQQDELAALRQAVARLRQEGKALDREHQELLATQVRLGIELERQLATLDTERSELQQRIARYEEERMLAVQSPVDGTLATVDVVAGSMVRPQQLLATIIPEQSQLTADVYIPSRAVGMIRTGQAVRLHYDAFPHQQFGAASGVVDTVAGFVSLPGDMPSAAGLREAAYKVRISVDSDHVQDGEARYALRPGMTLVAEVVLESRSLSEWLLASLQARL